MASILEIGNAWRAQIRRKGHKSVAETFPTKAQATQWARKIEAEMDAKRFKDVCGLANLTLKDLIDRYTRKSALSTLSAKTRARCSRPGLASTARWW
jgi:hypothetical protein